MSGSRRKAEIGEWVRCDDAEWDIFLGPKVGDILQIRDITQDDFYRFQGIIFNASNNEDYGFLCRQFTIVKKTLDFTDILNPVMVWKDAE